MTKLSCPRCGKVIFGGSIRPGDTIVCNGCGAEFEFAGQSSDAPSQSLLEYAVVDRVLIKSEDAVAATPQHTAPSATELEENVNPVATPPAPHTQTVPHPPGPVASIPATYLTPSENRIKLEEDEVSATGQAVRQPEPVGFVQIPQEQSEEPTPSATVAAATEAAEAKPTLGAPAFAEADVQQATQDAVPAVWNVGDVILDLYEVKQVHEGGGMGLVYRVHHREWGADMAVKCPRPDYFKSEAQKEKFVRECLAWVGLGRFEHVVTCFYVRTLGGIPRVFAEYVHAGSLQEWIADQRLYEGDPQFALRRILDIAIQFAWGLEYAHQQNLIHQDVKPANLLITKNGTAKVSDFGLANARATTNEGAGGPDARSLLASFGGMTPEYCSPEQANRRKLTRRSDIWSWAVSVLEIFTGEVTWAAGQIADSALGDYLGSGIEKSQIPKMPPQLAELLQQCLQQNPDDRPRDFAEVVNELKAAYASVAGEEYRRLEAKRPESLADALNNESASLLDLGVAEEAEQRLSEALKKEPHHPEAVYNRGLLQWRSGRITDTDLILQLEEARAIYAGSGRAEKALGLVHIERGDAESAIKVLETMDEKQKRQPEIRKATGIARSGLGRWWGCLQTFGSGPDDAESVTLNANGKRAISGARDGTLRLWDVDTGKCLMTFKGLRGGDRGITSVAFIAEGHQAISGSRDLMLRVWDVASGEDLWEFSMRGESYTSGMPTSIALSMDGRRVISGNEERLCLSDVASGECLQAFNERASKIHAVALSVDGRWVLTGCNDNTLRLWDLVTAECIRTFEGHWGHVSSVAFGLDDRWALSGSYDGTLRLWDVRTGKCLQEFKGHTRGVTSVALSMDNRWALSGSYDATLRLWDVATGRCLRTFQGHPDTIFSMDLSRDAWRVISGSSPSSVSGKGAVFRLWDISPRRRPPRSEWLVAGMGRTEECYDLDGEFAVHLAAARKLASEHEPGQALTALGKARSVPGRVRDERVLEQNARIGAYCRTISLRSGWHVRTFEGHEGAVNSVAVTADGSCAISGADDHTLRLWDLSTAECLWNSEGHTYGHVHSVALDRNGQRALWGEGTTPRLWDVATGECLRAFRGHTREVNCVALSADGRHAVSGADDHTLRLWELATGECLRTFEGHESGVYSVAMSEDGRWALSGSGDWSFRLWDLTTGECLRRFKEHSQPVDSVALSADRRLALSTCGSYGVDKTSSTVRLWSLTTGKCSRTFEFGHGFVRSLAVTRDGRRAIWGAGKTLGVWDVATGECLRTLETHTGDIHAVALSEDGHRALSGGEGTLRLWDVASGECLQTFGGHTSSVESVALSADGRRALSSSFCTSGDVIRLWDVATGECIRVFDGHRGPLKSVALSTDSRLALSGSEDKTLRLWSVETGQCLRTIQPDDNPVTSVALSPDGRWALSAGPSRSLCLWDVTTGEHIGCSVWFEGHADAFYSVAFCPNGRQAISGGRDNAVRLWELATGGCLRKFEGHTDWVYSVCLSEDGRKALSGSEDQTLRLWDVATGQCLRKFEGHTECVTSVALSVNDQWALSGSEDSTVRLWDMATGQCLREFEGHTERVKSVAFTSDCRSALSASAGTLHLWYLDWDFEFPGWADWDEGARPHLVNFLTLHTPYSGTIPTGGDPTREELTLALTRKGKPSWTEDDFKQLLYTLGCAGYGWLRPEGVRRELEQMAAERVSREAEASKRWWQFWK